MFTKVFYKKGSVTPGGNSSISLNPLLQFHVLEANNCILQGDYKKALFHCQEALLLDNPSSYCYDNNSQADITTPSNTDKEYLYNFNFIRKRENF